jgi:hypothetical protein
VKKRSATIGCSRFARNASINTGGQRIYGYPEGFELELRVISDADSHELDSQLIRAGRAGHLELDEQGLPTPEMLRFAVPFADGSGATNTTPVSRDLNTPPDGPVMQAQGGGGGGGAGNWRQSLWIWPLPPAGSLSFICEWPALEIPVSRHQIDAQQVLDAAGRAQTIFAHDHLPLHHGRSGRIRPRQTSHSSSRSTEAAYPSSSNAAGRNGRTLTSARGRRPTEAAALAS